MRLESVFVRDVAPVRRFEVDGMADMTVIAGPNGVGKTRLARTVIDFLRSGQPTRQIGAQIAATSAEERDSWGKDLLDLASQPDLDAFRLTLQASRRRSNWKSSLLNFDSDRTIQKLDSLAFSWEIVDPDEEDVGWDVTFGFMRDRYQDTVHSMFRKIEAQKQRIANRAIDLRRQGKAQMNLNFDDPMEPFKEVFALLVGPKEMAQPSARDQRLQYVLDGATYDFSTLSSGEREVVNIAFDFLLRKPQDCIVFFDEPELHLHPELSYRLIRTLRTIGSNNQFILCTHSPDIISASLDQTVVFVAPPSENTGEQAGNQAVLVSEADETNQALHLLGHSIGIISLGKRIVLIEGEHSSLDKQVYGSILGASRPELVLLPSGGKHVIKSFEAVHDAVLSRTMWGVDFFMLCDRDSVPPGTVGETGSRLRVLSRYHLENYFLDEDVWASAFASIEPEGSPLRAPNQVREVLRELARELVSYAVALRVATEVRLSVGNVDVMLSGCDGLDAVELQSRMAERLAQESARFQEGLKPDRARESVVTAFGDLNRSLDQDTDLWKELIPGKPLLSKFASRVGLSVARARQMYLVAAARAETSPFEEIRRIFAEFAQFDSGAASQ